MKAARQSVTMSERWLLFPAWPPASCVILDGLLTSLCPSRPPCMAPAWRALTGPRREALVVLSERQRLLLVASWL